MYKINKQYLRTTIFLFIIEILIALFVKDRFIRPFFGDYLVAILVFYFFKIFSKQNDWNLAWLSLGICYLVEILQYINVLRLIGLSENKLAVIIAGNSFAWEDMLCYTLGILSVLCFEFNFIKYYFPKSESN
jgi:hypothetical protein